MHASRKSTLQKLGIILYGIVAGVSATVLTFLGSIALAGLSGSIAKELGWKRGVDLAGSGLAYIYHLADIGFLGATAIVVGLIVCLRVGITRLRDASTA